MINSLNLINSVNHCNTILELAANEQAGLEIKLALLLRKQSQNRESLGEIENDLLNTQTSLISVNTVIAAIASYPNHPKKARQFTRLKKLELEEHLLLDRKEQFSLLPTLEHELKILKVEKELEIIKELVKEVTERKAGFVQAHEPGAADV